MTNPARFVVPLASAIAEESVGGKARNLTRLAALGFAVPPAIVVTDAALRAFLAVGGLHEQVCALCTQFPGGGYANVKAAAEAIAGLFLDAPLPAGLGMALDARVASLPPGPLVVRSSAIGEDSSAASFAGQLDSITDVMPGDSLHRAVVRVWASRWSARTLAYERSRGVTLRGMGVIVQGQIDARLSGVLFTRSPKDDGRMVIEYCRGMGEALVSGRENPWRATVRRDDSAIAHEARPDRNAEPAPLDESHILALARAAARIEAAFEAPQDIEWAIDDDGRLWFLQSRPITPSGARTEVRWSNANVNENFPQPITPLLYSIASEGYYHYFRNLGRACGVSRRRLARMEQPLRHIIGVHGARMYYNLSSIHAVLRSAPAGEMLAASFDQFVGAEHTDTPPASAFRHERQLTRQAIEIGAIVARTTWQYASLTRRVERFERRAAAFADRTRPERLRDRPLPDLLEDFRTFLDIRCHRWNDAALADAGSMVCYGLLQRLLARAFPEADAGALHNSLLKALPNLVSSKPALELWKLARHVRTDRALSALFAAESPADVVEAIREDERFASFRREFDRFLDDWGFRCSGELMLTVPSFQERPEAAVDLVKAYVQAPSPHIVLRDQAEARLQATKRIANAIRHRQVLRFLPRALQAPAFRVVLAGTQKSIGLRERARLKQALLYSRLRRIVLEMGSRLCDAGRLDRADDLFFLTANEIDALVSGAAMFPRHVRSLVFLRRQAHAEMSALTPPDSLTLGPGEYYLGAEERTPDGTGQMVDDRAPDPGSPSLHGLAACGGSTTGPAAVLGDVTESHRLRPGAVLVTRQTDPGWGPIFPLVSGLVIERGGMLSHGAIIAREFGIPSVVGVKDATRLIPDGSRVRIDGDRGLVQILAADGVAAR